MKIAFRNLFNNKAYSLINLFGLTTGLICFWLIGLYIFDELTFDSFHKDAGRIYRIIEHKTSATGKESKIAGVAWNISDRIKKEFPAVDNACRLTVFGRSPIINDENRNTFYEDYYAADAAFLNVLDFPMVQGDRTTALKAPYTVVVSDEMALKLFGSKNIVGKVIRTNREGTPYTITGVMHIPKNSHLDFNLLFSEATSITSSNDFRNFTTSDWSSNTFATYIKIKAGQSAPGIASGINKLVATNRFANADKSSFTLQPLKDIHFYSSGIDRTPGPGSNIMYMYVFALVGIFVLLIACINYVNLTTALFSTRSKEIAVRKVSGADQKNLVSQFITEALLLTLIAQVLALICVKLLLPAFNAFTEKQLSLGTSTNIRIWLGILLITLLVGLLAGIYPAFYQARLKPFLLLKNKIQVAKGHLSFRRVLVIVQFSLSIIMIIVTLVVYLQLKYIGKKDLGFKKDQLVVVDINSRAVRNGAERIKTEYARLAGVKSVCVTSRVPGEWKTLPKVKLQKSGSQAPENETMYYIAADDQFLRTYNVGLQHGRNFMQAEGDSTALLVNEAAAHMLGIKEPGEQPVDVSGIQFSGEFTAFVRPMQLRIVGIVKDFNFQSLREPLAPMVIGYKNNPIHAIDYFTAKVAAGNMRKTIKQMETVLHQVDPDHLFEYNFLDKQWELFYREDQKRQVIFLSVTCMTILIACLGLFGLVTFAARQRTKEIGIRKVLGASVSHVVMLLSKDFLKLVLIASLVAFPVAGWAMYKWLQDFAYRIHLSIWLFVGAGLLAALIALCTISFQAIKAALSNPVKALRSE
ncbi:FtsX-like permease family protein [Niastella caeni]|uniref:FtsX-like permease family protein n=1 Tax=Niastella caeni TaxID=2569763 RepID=UPI00140CAE27|nr:FtsX-like permease family protein [Niastella caeni]